MNKILTTFVLSILMASGPDLYADTYVPASNLLIIPSVQVGLATYTNVKVNLGSDFQVLNAASVTTPATGPVTTVDVFDGVNLLLTVPLVNVNSAIYQNVEVKLGSTYVVESVGGCTGCGTTPTPSNMAPLIVDNGPVFNGQLLGSANVAYTTVTICQPGTQNCQNFDHITVDTGSTGFRVLSSQVMPSLNLPAVTSNDQAVFECTQFVNSYDWGSVRLADVQIGGKVARNIPIQVIGDNPNVPSSCSSNGGASMNTVDTFGANGIIGVGNFIYDCGTACVTPPAIPGTYYTCSGANCESILIPLNQQVPNPVAFFPSDNNGTVIQLPAIPASGASNVPGVLTFGIGTESNNSLGSALIFTLDPTTGNFTTIYNRQTLANSFVDSGSSALFFNNPNINICQFDGASYCPTQTLSLQQTEATNQGQNGVSGSVTFTIADATILFNNQNLTAFDLGVTNSSAGSFDWGLPFFYGRSVFTAIENFPAGSATGPYVAY